MTVCAWAIHLFNIIAWVLALRIFQDVGWSALFWLMVAGRVGSAFLSGAEATGGYLDRAVWFPLFLVPLWTADWLGVLVALALFAVWQGVAKLGMYSLRRAVDDARGRVETSRESPNEDSTSTTGNVALQTFDELHTLAEQGDVEAQYSLGLAYGTGRGVPQDTAEAVQWYRLAADQGLATAQSNLGVMYANGEGVPQNNVEAVRWYRLAAEQGFATAQVNLGGMYADGDGVPQDYAEALRWYGLAAEQGDANAQYGLGLMYANGWGVPKENVEAHMWFNLAAAQSSGENLDRYVEVRDGFAEFLTAEQIAEAQRRAREWTPTPEP